MNRLRYEHDLEMLDDEATTNESINKLVLKFVRLREQAQARELLFRRQPRSNKTTRLQHNGDLNNNTSPWVSVSGDDHDDGDDDDNDQANIEEDEFGRASRVESSWHRGVASGAGAALASTTGENARFASLLFGKAWRETSFHEATTWRSAWQRLVTELDDLKLSDIDKYLKTHTHILRVCLTRAYPNIVGHLSFLRFQC